jgi:hypothetical protein
MSCIKDSHLTEENKLKISLALKGRIVSQETRQRMSLAQKGKTFSEESRHKLSLAKQGQGKGRKVSEETKRKISLQHMGNKICVGRILSEETKLKMSKAQMGKTFSEETRAKMSLNHANFKGVNSPAYGTHLSEERKLKISKAHMGITFSEERRLKISGENSRLWRGGSSHESYPQEFNHQLKESIRERDGYFCQFCHAEQNGRKLIVHHIDYNKYNLQPNNLISLCNNCHGKTNFNREYYTEYFDCLLNKEIAICR